MAIPSGAAISFSLSMHACVHVSYGRKLKKEEEEEEKELNNLGWGTHSKYNTRQNRSSILCRQYTTDQHAELV